MSTDVADRSVPPWLVRAWQSPWPWLALIVVLFCVPLFLGLDRHDLENDEAIYSFSVKVMVQAGDWLTPKAVPSDTSPFLEKPPLKFWIVGLPIHWGLLPLNEFGLRFWDAVIGSLAFLYVFAIGRRIAGPICGLGAVFLLFAHGALVLNHGLRTNNMEAAVVLTYAAGMYHFLAWRDAAPDNRTHVFAMALYFVLGFMTKFVAALFMPLVVLIAMLIKPADRFRLRMNWLTFVLAALLALALIGPWFAYQYAVRGSELINTMFGEHVMKRFTAYLDPAHLHPWHYYVTELWRQLGANGTQILTIAGALLVVARTIRHRWLEGALIVLWFVVPTTLISIGTSKLYHYEYPFLAPVALCGGYAVAWLTTRTWRWFKQPAQSLAAWRDQRFPAWAHSFPARATGFLGLGGLILAAATACLGRVRLAIGDTVLFRNSGTLRAFLPGAVLTLAGAPAFLIRSIVPLGALLVMLPAPAYRATIDHELTWDRPLHDISACLQDEIVRGQALGRTPPGIWIEARVFTHTYSYYLRDLGNWQAREMASNRTVAMHLLAPSIYRPVMLSRERFDNFMEELKTDRDGLLRKAAERAETALDVVEAATANPVGVFDHEGLMLMLPGPYAHCAPEQRDLLVPGKMSGE